MVPAGVHQGAPTPTWMRSYHPTPAQRNRPMRLSPSAIPLAVVTTLKTTDIGALLGSIIAHYPRTQDARAHASLPKVSPENPTPTEQGTASHDPTPPTETRSQQSRAPD